MPYIRSLREAFVRFRDPALQRVRDAGYRVRNTAFLIRQDFERGVWLGLVLDGERGILPFGLQPMVSLGRPVPDPSYEAVSSTATTQAATAIILGSFFFLWVFPMICEGCLV